MLSTIFQNILQSIDKMRIPMFNLIIGTIIRLVSCYILMGIPGINIYGIGISSTVTFAFLMFANYYFVKRFSGVKIQWMKSIIIPLIASLVMGGICWLVYWPINAVIGNKIAVALAVIAAVVVYVLFLFVFRIVSEDELLSIPGGKLLIPLYRKLSPSGRKRRKK